MAGWLLTQRPWVWISQEQLVLSFWTVLERTILWSNLKKDLENIVWLPAFSPIHKMFSNHSIRKCWSKYSNLISPLCHYFYYGNVYKSAITMQVKSLVHWKVCSSFLDAGTADSSRKLGTARVNKTRREFIYKHLGFVFFFQCKVLAFLTLNHTILTFYQPWERCLLKTWWEKEKMLVTSMFSFSHNVFYTLSSTKFQLFIYIHLASAIA